jgi:hypothetical protein
MNSLVKNVFEHVCIDRRFNYGSWAGAGAEYARWPSDGVGTAPAQRRLAPATRHGSGPIRPAD